jgi:hypothetical protein
LDQLGTYMTKPKLQRGCWTPGSSATVVSLLTPLIPETGMEVMSGGTLYNVTYVVDPQETTKPTGLFFYKATKQVEQPASNLVPVPVPVPNPTTDKQKTNYPVIDQVLVGLKAALSAAMSFLKAVAWVVLTVLVVLALIAVAIASLPEEAVAAVIVGIAAALRLATNMISSGAASATTVMNGTLGRSPPGA